MNLMLQSLTIMIGIGVALVGLTLILSLAGATGLSGDFLGSVVQLLAFVVLYYSVKSGYRLAVGLFVAFCLLTLFDGMTFEASLAGLFDALFAVLAFVGLAGAWHWRKDRRAICPLTSSPRTLPPAHQNPLRPGPDSLHLPHPSPHPHLPSPSWGGAGGGGPRATSPAHHPARSTPLPYPLPTRGEGK